jgi:hypothetical protein
MPIPPRVLTQRNDPGRSGINRDESTLNPDNVNLNSFGLLGHFEVDGDVYAQPLYVPNVDIGQGQRRNVLVVATMQNSVFAFDADKPGSIFLWRKTKADFGDPVPSQLFRPFRDNRGNVQSGYHDMVGASSIGILSTPVVDAAIDPTGINPTTGTIYCVVETWNGKEDATVSFEHRLFAIDVGSGAIIRGPRKIEGSATGSGYVTSDLAKMENAPPNNPPHSPAVGYLVSLGFQNSNKTVEIMVNDTDHSNPQSPRVLFNSITQLQRPGLLLQSGKIIIAFGSRGDEDPWHGWIFAYDAKTFDQVGVFCTTPRGARGGIWQAGQGLVDDGLGNFYAGSGNGDSRNDPVTFQNPDLGESFFKSRLTESGIRIVGWINAFDDISRRMKPDGTTPDDQKVFDDDVGASSPVLLSDGKIAAGGKDGWFYLIDPKKLDKMGTKASVNQAFIASYNDVRGTRTDRDANAATHHIHGAPIALDLGEKGSIVYVWGENDVVRAYHYAPEQGGDPSTGRFDKVPDFQDSGPVKNVEEVARGTKYASSEDPLRKAMPGGLLSLSMSRNDPASAILWVSVPPFHNGNLQLVAQDLVAYEATSFDTNLPFARLNMIWSARQHPNDNPGRFAKFCCPTIAGGRVYLATAGIKDPTTGIVVKQVRVYGLKVDQNGLRLSDGGYNVGFGGNNGLTFNGSAAVNIDAGNGKRNGLMLTDVAHPVIEGGGLIQDGQVLKPFNAGSVFSTAAVDVSTLDTTFTILLEEAVADGFTFTIQAEGRFALGGDGNGLGYGPNTGNPPVTPQPTIAHSFAVIFRYFGSPGFIGVRLNGQAIDGAPDQPLPNSLDLRNGPKFFSIHLVYDGSSVVADVSRTDANTGAPLASQSFSFVVGDIAAHIMSTTKMAHIGFTGGTGLSAARQIVTKWTVV